jgi:hypothetical protein
MEQEQGKEKQQGQGSPRTREEVMYG